MQSACFKRMKREISMIEETFPEYRISDFIQNTDKTMTLILYTPKYNQLVFTIPTEYPFKPPLSLTINGENYRYRLKNIPKRLNYLYHHPHKLYIDDTSTVNISTIPTCLCCTSLLCAANWSPVICLTYILKEIDTHNDLKRHMIYKLRLKEIFNSKDLPLELFRNIYSYL